MTDALSPAESEALTHAARAAVLHHGERIARDVGALRRSGTALGDIVAVVIHPSHWLAGSLWQHLGGTDSVAADGTGLLVVPLAVMLPVAELLGATAKLREMPIEGAVRLLVFAGEGAVVSYMEGVEAVHVPTPAGHA